jgi:hypothetical protein
MIKKCKILKKSKTCHVIMPKIKQGVTGWLEKVGIEKSKKVVLYKRVTKDFKTQTGSKNETLWSIGSVLDHPNYEPSKEECGEGKYHACAKPYFCDEFMSGSDDRYIAVEITVTDLYAWPTPKYPYKIAFKKGKVLYECDKWGEKK